MLLLDAGASVDVWGHDLKGPLDLMEAREAQIRAEPTEQGVPTGSKGEAVPSREGATSHLMQQPAFTQQYRPQHGQAGAGIAQRTTPHRPKLTALLRQKSSQSAEATWQRGGRAGQFHRLEDERDVHT